MHLAWPPSNFLGRFWGTLLACAAISSMAWGQSTEAPDPELPGAFSALFNGTDLTGWRGRPHLDPATEASWTAVQAAAKQKAWNEDRDQHWSVENGELVNDGHGVFLTTIEDFADFDLTLEYRTVAQADSGIYLRANPQVQIWDTTEAGGKWKIGADKGSGGLWNNQKHARHPLVLADRPFGQWNTLRIRMTGERVSVWLNEKLTVDHTRMENYFNRALPLPRTGPIQLQTHGGEIRFRNLLIRRLDPSEANLILSSHKPEGFASVFNGLDFTGWSGPTDGYKIEHGAILCRQGSGGTIYTDQEYADFQARLEFKLPPGGNNGLAIRYPGKGNAAYDGMCELQVLDNTAAKYADLKVWQYHGSIYGQHPAQRGYLRPVGEWNFEQVTVQGSRIKVELNGTVIVDQDLAEIETPPSGHAHPGRSLTQGHFGFAGHQDPVRFRRISIKPLP
jgi:3-keto-disaccharide hydrolase